MPTYVRVLRVNAWNYPRISDKIRRGLADVVRKHATTLAADIRKDFKKPKHGRVYYYKGRRIRASAPGEAPAIRSGALFRNVTPVISANGMQARIDPRARGVKYAAWLEEGTSRMAPRPYINPSFSRRRQAFLNEVRTKLAKALH